MKKVQAAQDSDIWKKLMVLGQKQGSMKLTDLACEMGLNESDALSFIRQAFPEGAGLEVYFQDEEHWVDINAEAIQYMLPLSPEEWMEMHKLLEAKHKTVTPALMSLRKKIIENAPVKTLMRIMGKLDHWGHELNEKEQGMIGLLELSIVEKNIVRVVTAEKKSYSIFPCKVLHMEGELSLIAEDTQDHCLLILPLNALTFAEPLPGTSQPKMTEFEIEEFITAIRAMNEKETRLILKIHDPVAVNLFPHHHFLGKPCMITNPNGDLIWAAYVEPGPDLYDWLISLGRHVEILDPIKFKEEYLTYCEEKLRNVA